ncbi:hypothetical protein, partial [Streptomyces sp. SID3212]|uniref:hypothetical protein n=1 Tax=Streptomyces sp. SID3212 TaxID=2690259 RepID=UPI00235130EE
MPPDDEPPVVDEPPSVPPVPPLLPSPVLPLDDGPWLVGGGGGACSDVRGGTAPVPWVWLGCCCPLFWPLPALAVSRAGVRA